MISRRTPNRTGIYTRISLDKDKNKSSGGEVVAARIRGSKGVQRQREDCLAAAADLGWTVAEVYEDDSISASKAKVRPAYQRLLEDMSAGRIDAVIVWDADRLHRKPLEFEQFVATALEHGVRLALVSGEVDLTNDDDLMFLRFKGTMAASETAKMSKRLKRKWKADAAKGKPHPGPRRYGYLADHRTPHPVEAPVIVEAVDRILAGGSLHGIMVDFNNRNVPTAKGGPWRTTTLRQILMRPDIGGVHWFKRDAEGRPILTDHRFDGIVTEQQWRAVDAILTSPDRKPKHRSTRKHLLSGFARCGVCGGLLVMAPNQSGREGMAVRCKKQPQPDGKGGWLPVIDGPHVSRQVAGIEALVVDVVGRWLAEFTFTKPGAGASADQLALDAEVADLERQGREVEALVGQVAPARLARMLADIDGRLVALRSKQTARMQAAALVPFLGSDAWADADLDRRRAVLSALVSAVIVDPYPAGAVPRFSPSTVRLAWSNGEVSAPAADADEWVANALAVAPNSDDLARSAVGGLDAGVSVVDEAWKTWPDVVALDPAGAGRRSRTVRAS